MTSLKKGVFKMKNLVIKDVDFESIDDLVRLCIPQEKRGNPLYVRGMNVKKRWVTEVIRRFGSIAKLAYLDSKPVGLIQYQPNPEERVVMVDCIFVPEEANLRKGIGKALLKALIREMEKPKAAFNGGVPLALVTQTFEVPGRYSQRDFFERMGFKRVKEDNPFLLYYPLEKGYVYQPREKGFTPQEEDLGKALIFYAPSCPFSIIFSERIKESISEIAPDLPIRMVNTFEEPEEVEKRGQVPALVVNGKPIKAFFMDKENFQKEVKKALES